MPEWPAGETLWFFRNNEGQVWLVDVILERAHPLVEGSALRELVDELFDPGYAGPI